MGDKAELSRDAQREGKIANALRYFDGDLTVAGVNFFRSHLKLIQWGIHLTGVEWVDRQSTRRKALPALPGRVPGLVPDRCRLPRLPRMAAMAFRHLVYELRPTSGLAAG